MKFGISIIKNSKEILETFIKEIDINDLQSLYRSDSLVKNINNCIDDDIYLSNTENTYLIKIYVYDDSIKMYKFFTNAVITKYEILPTDNNKFYRIA